MKTIKTLATALLSGLMVFSPVAYADKWSDQFPHIKATGDIPGMCSYEEMSKKVPHNDIKYVKMLLR